MGAGSPDAVSPTPKRDAEMTKAGDDDAGTDAMECKRVLEQEHRDDVDVAKGIGAGGPVGSMTMKPSDADETPTNQGAAKEKTSDAALQCCNTSTSVRADPAG